MNEDLKDIHELLKEIKEIKEKQVHEIYLPHKGDYETRVSSTSQKKSRSQKIVWKKKRNKYISGMDRSLLHSDGNMYKSGFYKK